MPWVLCLGSVESTAKRCEPTAKNPMQKIYFEGSYSFRTTTNCITGLVSVVLGSYANFMAFEIARVQSAADTPRYNPSWALNAGFVAAIGLAVTGVGLWLWFRWLFRPERQIVISSEGIWRDTTFYPWSNVTALWAQENEWGLLLRFRRTRSFFSSPLQVDHLAAEEYWKLIEELQAELGRMHPHVKIG